MEKRGYILAACWTPECTVEHPEAVRQLAIEYARAGADITQTCTFYSDDKRLKELHGENAPTVKRPPYYENYENNLIKNSVRNSAKKSIKPHARLPKKLAGKEVPLWLEVFRKLRPIQRRRTRN